MIHRISMMLVEAFMHSNYGRLHKLRQCSNGWVGIIQDKESKLEYVIQIHPITSEKIVVPETFNQLMNMNEENKQ